MWSVVLFAKDGCMSYLIGGILFVLAIAALRDMEGENKPAPKPWWDRSRG